MDWGLTWSVVITGLLVVFCILIILTLIILGYGTLVYRIQNRKKNSPPQNPANKPKAKEVPVVQETLVQEEGVSGEIIAVIAAAVAMMGERTGSAYSIKSVRRSSGSRPVWSTAGLLENTRPFS